MVADVWGARPPPTGDTTGLPCGSVERPRHERREQLDLSPLGALPYGLVPIQQQRWAAADATAGVPLGELVTRPSGLLVPRHHATRPGPIDLLKVYVTDQEVLDARIGLERATAWLRQVSLAASLRFASHWLCRLQSFGADPKALDASFASTFFRGEPRARLEALLDTEYHLLVPQVLLVLLKIALFQCPSDRSDDEDAHLLPAVMLAIAGALGNFAEDEDRRKALEAEVLANQHFNSNHDLTNTMALFGYRWTTPDETDSPLEDAYLDATGVALKDVAVVALSLWVAAQNGASRVSRAYFRTLTWSAERLDAALNQISAPISTVKEEILSGEKAENWAAVEWLFSPLERYPVLQWENDYIIISPRFLQERVFGWPPAFDVENSLKSAGRDSDARRFLGRLRTKTETYARGVLDSIAPPSPQGSRRVYHESSLQAAFGQGQKTADAAIDYGDAWVVLEISTRRLARPVVYGRDGAIEQEIDVLVEKCSQIDATVKQLRRNEYRLTGHPALVDKRFHPVLVMTEGYAVNPLINARLREVLRMKHLLSGRDTDLVEVIDLQTLELVESIGEAGGPSLLGLIREKRVSGMANASLWDYLVVERKYSGERSARLQASWAKPFDWALEALGTEPERQ